ncbi:MAG TPA: hypothetical protein VEV38_06395 [Candidatus Eremiobacteraceae bacterium]|nr:hypothetical protein [Candidatus Eremiobacteraceae bacterium]
MSRILGPLAAIMAAMVAFPSTAFAYYGSPFATCAWHVVTSPNPFADQNVLNAVAATSATDAWAVGRTTNPNDGSIQPVAMHWNGKAWSLVSTPSVASANLIGVKEITPTDVWAVGLYYDTNNGQLQAFAEHWDGATWTAFTPPSLGVGTNVLNAVVANSTSDVWAFGRYVNTSGLNSTLAEHWNGSTWSVVTTPNEGSLDTVFTSGVANGTSNVWAAGAYNCNTGSCQTFAERWNGLKWKIVATPDQNLNSNPLNAMSSNGSKDMWAIGDYYTGSTFNTLAEHWNGTAWSIVTSPNMGLTALLGSAAVNTRDVWAVGFYQNGSIDDPYSMTWNGSAWSTVLPPTVGTSGALLDSAARIPGTMTLWSVGGSLNSNGSFHDNLVEKFHC